MGEEFCFEIVTKARVFYLVAKAESELNEWVHVLSQKTLLHKESELLEKAEAMISQESYRQSMEDEKRFLDAYKKRRKTTTNWSPRKSGSQYDLRRIAAQRPTLNSSASEVTFSS